MEPTAPCDPAGGGRRQQPEERGRKRKAEAEPRPVGPGLRLRPPAEWAALVTEADPAELVPLVIEKIGILDRTFSWREDDRVRALDAILALAAMAEKGKCVGEMVENGVIPALVKHLQAPPLGGGDKCEKFHEHQVEKSSAYALNLLAEKVSVVRIADLFPKFFKVLDAIKHRQLIVDYGALLPLLNLLKRHKAGSCSRGLIRWAAEAIAKLLPGDRYHFASNRVRTSGVIPVLVQLLEADDIYVQGAAAAALYSLASDYEEDANEVVTFREVTKQVVTLLEVKTSVLTCSPIVLPFTQGVSR